VTDHEQVQIVYGIQQCKDIEALRGVTLNLVGTLSRTREMLLQEMRRNMPAVKKPVSTGWD